MRGLIFIDGGNVFHSVKEHNKVNSTEFKINYEKLTSFLMTESKIAVLLRTYYYTGVPVNISEAQKGFLTRLEHIPNFEVRSKPLKMKNGKLIEKGVDVHIVTDMLWCGLNKHCEHIILVSGDEDLTEAINKLKENGIRVTIAAFKPNTSQKIMRAADAYIDLSLHVDKFKL